MSDVVRIQKASLADLDGLAELWTSFLEEQARIDDRFQPAEDALLRWRNDFPHWLEDSTRRLFIAKRHDVPVGFIVAHRWRPAPVYALSSEVYIDELFVVPEARVEGLGTRLLDEVRNWAQEIGAGRLRMGVLTGNEEAVQFWSQAGATPYFTTYTIEMDPSQTPDRPRKDRLGF